MVPGAVRANRDVLQTCIDFSLAALLGGVCGSGTGRGAGAEQGPFSVCFLQLADALQAAARCSIQFVSVYPTVPLLLDQLLHFGSVFLFFRWGN